MFHKSPATQLASGPEAACPLHLLHLPLREPQQSCDRLQVPGVAVPVGQAVVHRRPQELQAGGRVHFAGRGGRVLPQPGRLQCRELLLVQTLPKSAGLEVKATPPVEMRFSSVCTVLTQISEKRELVV